jgi:hypothetical protein
MIYISEYIATLQEMMAEHGDRKCVFTQSGYYSDGQFADLYTVPGVENILMPAIYQKIGAKDVCIKKEEFEDVFVLGHSEQSY